MRGFSTIGLRADYDAAFDIMRVGVDSDSLSQCNESAPQINEKIMFDSEHDFIWFYVEKVKGGVDFFTRAEILDWEGCDAGALIDYITKKTDWNKDGLKLLMDSAYHYEQDVPHIWDEILRTRPSVDYPKKFKFMAFLDCETLFSRQAKHSILDWHWEPGTGEDPEPTLRHVRETLAHPEEIIISALEEKRQKKYKNFILMRRKGLSDPQPKEPYVVVVKYFPDKQEKVVLTAFSTFSEPNGGTVWREKKTVGHA